MIPTTLQHSNITYVYTLYLVRPKEQNVGLESFFFIIYCTYKIITLL